MANNYTSIDLNGAQYQFEVRSSDDVYLLYVRRYNTLTLTWENWQPLGSHVEVANIVERDALTNVQNGVSVFVSNALPDVPGSALYLYAGGNWIRIYPISAVASFTPGLGINEVLAGFGIAQTKLNNGGIVTAFTVDVSGTTENYEGDFAAIKEGILVHNNVFTVLATAENSLYYNNVNAKYLYYTYYSNSSQTYYIFAKRFNSVTLNWQWVLYHLGAKNPESLNNNDVITVDLSLPGRDWTPNAPGESIAGENLRDGYTQPPLTDQTSNATITNSSIISNRKAYIRQDLNGLYVPVSTNPNTSIFTDDLLTRGVFDNIAGYLGKSQTYDISSSTTIEGNQATAGKYTLTSVNPTGIIDEVLFNTATSFPIQFSPEIGLIVTFEHLGSNLHLQGGVNAIIDGSKFEFITLEQIPGTLLWREVARGQY